VPDWRLPDFFASSVNQASTVEGSFVASGQEQPGASTAMWLSGPGAQQPGMTPRFRVTTLSSSFAFLPQEKRRWMLGEGGLGAPSIQRRSHNGCFQVAFWGDLKSGTQQSYIGSFRGSLSRSLDFVPCLFLAWRNGQGWRTNPPNDFGQHAPERRTWVVRYLLLLRPSQRD
jgi:hypothetical protein